MFQPLAVSLRGQPIFSSWSPHCSIGSDRKANNSHLYTDNCLLYFYFSLQFLSVKPISLLHPYLKILKKLGCVVYKMSELKGVQINMNIQKDKKVQFLSVFVILDKEIWSATYDCNFQLPWDY